MKLLKSVGRSLAIAAFLGVPHFAAPSAAIAMTVQQDSKYGTVKGTVKSDKGEELTGAIVFVVGTQNSTFVDIDGTYALNNVKKGSTISVTLIGYTCDDVVWNGGALNFIMKEEGNQLDEVVVTAMGPDLNSPVFSSTMTLRSARKGMVSARSIISPTEISFPS